MPAVLRTDYDRFLFAPIGEGANGMPLTVISVLARLDVDPWEEAATLAGLPVESATQRLTSILAASPNARVPADESVAIATRLVALLQRAPGPQVSSAQAPPNDAVATPPKVVNRAVYYLIALIFMLVWQWAAAIQHPQIPADSSTPSIATAT